MAKLKYDNPEEVPVDIDEKGDDEPICPFCGSFDLALVDLNEETEKEIKNIEEIKKEYLEEEYEIELCQDCGNAWLLRIGTIVHYPGEWMNDRH